MDVYGIDSNLLIAFIGLIFAALGFFQQSSSFRIKTFQELLSRVYDSKNNLINNKDKNKHQYHIENFCNDLEIFSTFYNKDKIDRYLFRTIFRDEFIRFCDNLPDAKRKIFNINGNSEIYLNIRKTYFGLKNNLCIEWIKDFLFYIPIISNLTAFFN